MSKINRVWRFMTKDEWLPKGEIFFSITGGFSEQEQDVICEKHKKKLLEENEDNYARWVFTEQVRKEVQGMGGTPFVTVLGFRVRDSY